MVVDPSRWTGQTDLPAGAFPRQFSEDDTSAGAVLFTNYDGLTVSVIPGSDLSWLRGRRPVS
jgi:hypothetical protein